MLGVFTVVGTFTWNVYGSQPHMIKLGSIVSAWATRSTIRKWVSAMSVTKAWQKWTIASPKSNLDLVGDVPVMALPISKYTLVLTSATTSLNGLTASFAVHLCMPIVPYLVNMPEASWERPTGPMVGGNISLYVASVLRLVFPASGYSISQQNASLPVLLKRYYVCKPISTFFPPKNLLLHFMVTYLLLGCHWWI